MEQLTPIKINIYTTIENHPETIEMKARGVLSRSKDLILVEYEDRAVFGDCPQTNRIGISENFVTINRLGSIDSTMIFEKGKYFNGVIATPGGSLPLSVYSHKVDLYFGEETLCVKLKYTLDIGGSETVNDLTLKATVIH